MSYRHIGGPIIELLTGAFDEPERVVPTYAVGTESTLSWVSEVADLPGRTTAQNTHTVELASIVSHQHPDCDTADDWMPPRR